MHIWVDADACPKLIKDILFRAAIRTKIMTIFVANQSLTIPRSPFLKTIRVAAGFDVADNHIVQVMQAGDLVITADIPLADAVVSKGGMALNPRGELYTKLNIKHQLAIRNLHTELRSSGMISGGPAKLNPKENRIFAAHLDQLLSQRQN